MRSLLLAAAVGFALPAAAQPFQPDARPAAGTLSPRADRAPEALDLTIRGAASSGRDDCPGYFEASAPDAVVDWRGGRLRLTVRSSTDATLAVVDPQGTWHCNDDADNLMPAVELPGAARGRYAVWVGSFVEGGGDAATLLAGTPMPATADPRGRPQVELDVRAGFAANGPLEHQVTAGGLDAVGSLGLQAEGLCNGFVDAAHPTARVRYSGAGDRVTVRAWDGIADPVLLVRTPSGMWLCDDDSGEGVGAALALPAEAGDYAVWVGTFGSGARTEAPRLRMTLDEDEVLDPDLDMDFEGEDMDFAPTPYSSGTYQALDVSSMPARRLALGTDDTVSADVRVAPTGANPVMGDACRGFLETSPTAAVTFGGDGPVGITASTDRDLVLVVQTPGGEWFCSDDADGLNPGVQFDTVESGTYRVWVGAFATDELGQMEPVEATLTLARGPITVSGGMEGMDGGLGMGESFAEGFYDGQDLRPDAPSAATLGVGDEASVSAGGTLLNPVAGPTCTGFVTATPTATVRVDGMATFHAMPAEPDDLVLLVHTPDGRWLCGDDADGGPDPTVSVEGGGDYHVWVGTYSRRDAGVPATLHVMP